MFDKLNRKTSCADLQEQAENTTRTYTYNSHSALTSASNAQGHVDSSKYDARDRAFESTDKNNLTTGYTYDDNNNLLSLTDPRGNTRSWIYDARNLVTRKQMPEAGDKCNYRYDALRRKHISGKQNGSVIYTNFDLAGRAIEKVYSIWNYWPAWQNIEPPAQPSTPESTDTFTYDGANRILTTHKGRYNVGTAHSYADDGLPLTETTQVEARLYTMSRTYDAANRVATHTFADGNVMEWVYDARNVVTEVKYDGDQVLIQNHDAAYRLIDQTFGNGFERSLAFGRLDNLRTNDKVKKGSTTIDELDFDYTYAADKNVLSESNSNGMFEDLSFNVTYDPGNRVASWTRVDQYPGARETQSWNYDTAGNWNATTIDGNTQSRVNNTSDEVTDIDGDALTYDNRGNLTEDESGQKLHWAPDNRIRRIQPVGAADILYKYDAFSRRVYRKQNTAKEVLLWWGKEEYAEHKHQAGQATIQNDLHAHPRALNTTFGRAIEGHKYDIQYFHKNYLDHVYAVSNDTGNVIEQYRYSAFGEVEVFDAGGNLLAGTAIDNDILWNVKRYDAATGLYMYLYRHYDPEHGRWPSRDPIEGKRWCEFVCICGESPLSND